MVDKVDFGVARFHPHRHRTIQRVVDMVHCRRLDVKGKDRGRMEREQRKD